MKKAALLILAIISLFFLYTHTRKKESLPKEKTLNFEEIVRETGKKNDTKQHVKIAFATPLFQVSDYWRRSIRSFEGRMKELGIRCTIKKFSSVIDKALQLEKAIYKALKSNSDYLVLTLNGPKDKNIISRLLTKNSPKIIIQNLTIPLKEWKATPPFIYIGFSHITGTKLLAKEYVKRFGRKKRISYAVLFHVENNDVSKLRGNTFIDLMEEYKNYHLVQEFYTRGSKKKAYYAAKKIIKKYPDIHFIYCCSTDIAFGALTAIQESHKNIIVNGWGGGTLELKSIQNKGLNFTVMRMNDDNGVAMAEAIRLDLLGKTSSIPKVFCGKMVLVNESTSPSKFIALKKYAFRYSGF